MQMAVLFALFFVGAVVLLKLLFPVKPASVAEQFHKRRLHEGDRRTGSLSKNPFHAVSIHPAAQGCAAAHTVKSERFLSEDAPTLPLADCSEKVCHCTYVHHIDRRRGTGDRRFGPIVEDGVAVFSSTDERRINPGRRDGDLEAA